MIWLTRRYRFSASHRLHLAALTEEENNRLYGKCNNPYGHGHDYILEVTCSGPVNAETGTVVARVELDRLVETEVLGIFAFSNVNVDVPAFRSRVPTTENMAAVIAEVLQDNWRKYVGGAATLVRVHIQETNRNSFELRLGVNDTSAVRDVKTLTHA